MEDLTLKEIKTLAYLVGLRLKYESRRNPRRDENGVDVQNRRVWEMATLLDKLETMKKEYE